MNNRYAFERAATTIMHWLHIAEQDLLGHTIATFNGETGTVVELKLDEHHGLCFTCDEPLHSIDMVEGGRSRKWYPTSTIKHYGAKA